MYCFKSQLLTLAGEVLGDGLQFKIDLPIPFPVTAPGAAAAGPSQPSTQQISCLADLNREAALIIYPCPRPRHS